MNNPILAESKCTVDLGAPITRVDLTAWLFTLRDDEYQRCSKAHLAAGSSRTPDGKRMSINVERPGDTLLIQHYVEDLATRERCRVVSDTEAFTALGPSYYRVIWEISVTSKADGSSSFTNYVRVEATPHFMQLLAERGVPLEQFTATAQRIVDEHNAEETPLFAANIEAKALDDIWKETRLGA